MLILAFFVLFFAAFVAVAVFALRKAAIKPQPESAPEITDVALNMHRGPAPTASERLLQP